MIKEIVQNSVKDLVAESSLSRVWQHINDPDTQFAIISAYVYKHPDNGKRHQELQNRVRDLGYGYIELDSGYTYYGEDEDILIEEKSLMIPGIRKPEAVKLGYEFDQESILFKKGTDFVLLGTSKQKDSPGTMGSVLMRFQTGSDNMTFDPEVVQNAFSSLSSDNRDFAFVAEQAIKDFPTRMVQQTADIIGNDWIVIMDET